MGEARPYDQGEALSLIRMVGSNVREARRNLRLASSMQRELLQAVRGLGQGGRALQRRVRESVQGAGDKKASWSNKEKTPFCSVGWKVIDLETNENSFLKAGR